MSKIKNGGLDQYGTGPFEQRQFGTAVVEGVNERFNCETWKSTIKVQKKLDVFCQRNLRKIIGVTWKDKVTNAEVLTRSRQKYLHDTVEERRLRFAGHIIRMASEHPANHAVDWIPADEKRKRSRPWKTWQSTFQEDCQRCQSG